ncbi:MAG: hypothetical protein P1V35_11650 [Planctomycetota bacterium]|nr:hypothetical protein [Planctomycetota bacterium]
MAWLQDHLPSALEDWEEEGREGTLELILTRSVAAEKRSQAHVNHRPVTQKMQRELAGLLVEIHGQNDQQRLFDPEEQLRLLDTFGGMHDTLQGYRERRARWIKNAERLEGYASQEAERLQRLDLLRFQVSELLEAGDAVRDKDALLAERARLRHAGGLGLELSGVSFGLFEAEGCALDELHKATKVLEGWAAKVPDVEEPLQALHGATAYLEDTNNLLASLVDGVESDPQRLDELETQLVVVEHLERKYGTDAAGLLVRIDELQGELDELQALEAGEDALQEQVVKDFESMQQSASRLSKGRRKLVKRLQKEVESALEKLGLAGSKFCVEWVEVEGAPDAELAHLRRMYGPQGAEKMEFQLSANPGEPVAPLRAVASGGEMARIMLALRGALAVRLSTPTLIFDEVDTGVGGRLGPEVADHLARLASHHQVLCVTHLPAIAARAAGHLKVEKTTEKGRTHTHVVALFGKGREMEIADMIAGGGDQKTALAEARRLLSAAPH